MAALELGNDNSQQSLHLHLPKEIIEQEILSRTSVKSLLKFRCVSKSWRCLIDSEEFIKAHLENSRKNTCFLKHMVIFNHQYHALHQYCNLQSLVNGASSHPVKDPPSLNFVRVSFVGGFNGVACLLERSRYFIMWNPSTRKSKRLPEIEIDHGVTNGTKAVHHYGIGFESSGEYKIFAVIGERRFGRGTVIGERRFGRGTGYVGKVYSSKTSSWNTVRHEGSNLDFEEAVGQFVNGKLHWLLYQAPFYIGVSFDLKSEVLALIELPCERVSGRCWSLGVLGGKLCVLLNQLVLIEYDDWRVDADVWVMKEYGVKDSWRKLEPPFPTSSSFFHKKKGEGEVVVFLGHAFLVYNPNKDVFVYMDRKIRGVLMCIQSLVQP